MFEYQSKIFKFLVFSYNHFVFTTRQRATVHESLKHPWICSNDETTLSNEQTIDSLDEEEEEEEEDEEEVVVTEEVDELPNEIVAQNFN